MSDALLHDLAHGVDLEFSMLRSQPRVIASLMRGVVDVADNLVAF
jgi:hypothetical protein